jgi:uncharacterized protein GlcG (DUF336 family)
VGGNLVAHVRMDNARIGAIDIAINKAWTARAFDMDSAELGRLSQPGAPFFGIHDSNGDRVMLLPGGHYATPVTSSALQASVGDRMKEDSACAQVVVEAPAHLLS